MQTRQLFAAAALGLSLAACASAHAPASAVRARRSVWPFAATADRCGYRDREERAHASAPRCEFAAREVRAWGPTPREAPPAARCPIHVRVVGNSVVAEPAAFEASFDALPWHECVPREYLTGARHAMQVEDGWLVAYEGVFGNVVFWASEDGRERVTISHARVLGFARAPSGAVLALAAGPARLGRGAVLSFQRTPRGRWTTNLVTALPIEPSGTTFDDGGVILGFGQGFVFRVDEKGQVENVHYFARDIGHVTSIARAPRGTFFLGLECGVLAVDPDDHSEVWWSARDGASGHWRACGT